jgi:6-pyruvoyltetrahydropterin/6-carboxytetrahydropterin synthase
LVKWDAEPTAENMLIFIKQMLSKSLPDNIKLVYLKLFETKDSYAEWINDTTFTRY